MHRRGSTRAKKQPFLGPLGPECLIHPDPHLILGSGVHVLVQQGLDVSPPQRRGPGPSTRDGLDQVPPRPWNTWNIWNLQGSTPRRVKEETFTSWAQQAQEQGHKPPELVLNISLLERHRSSLCSMHSFNEPSKSQEVNLSIESPTRQQ
jgi:hypothetical protein